MSHVRGVAPILAPDSTEAVSTSRRGARAGAAVLALALGGVFLFSLVWRPPRPPHRRVSPAPTCR